MHTDGGWTLDIPSFFIGWGIAWYFGLILARIRKERVTMQKTDKYMTVETKQTPRQVFILADAAFWRCLGYWILFIISVVIVFGGIIYMLYGSPD